VGGVGHAQPGGAVVLDVQTADSSYRSGLCCWALCFLSLQTSAPRAALHEALDPQYCIAPPSTFPLSFTPPERASLRCASKPPLTVSAPQMIADQDDFANYSWPHCHAEVRSDLILPYDEDPPQDAPLSL
jgi:hypothetical protein